MLRIPKISALNIMQLIVEEQAVECSGEIVMGESLGGGNPNWIGLMPAAHTAPHLRHKVISHINKV